MGKGRCTSLSRRFVFVALNLSLPPRSSPYTMSSLKHHPSLPAPVFSAGANLKAKSSVLTGVQDAYWSDEEVKPLFFFSVYIYALINCAIIFPSCRRRRNAHCALKKWISLTSTSNLASANIRYLIPPFFLLSFLYLKHSIALQICRFCWNHIRTNLNNKCPACRRDYSDEVGQFKPINKEECVALFIFHSIFDFSL